MTLIICFYYYNDEMTKPIGLVGIEQVVMEAHSKAARRELRRLDKTPAMIPPPPPVSEEAWWDEYHPKRRKL